MSRFGRPLGDESSGPERLRAGAGSQLEQRVLNAAAREAPTREMCERMALAIGVAPPPIAPAGPSAPEPGTAASQIGAGSRGLLVGLSAGVIVVAVAAIVATRSGGSAPSRAHSAPTPVNTASASAPVPALATTASPPSAPSAAVEAPPAGGQAPVLPRSRLATSATDIQAQIALIDAARAALVGGASQRALALVSQYQSKYAAGSFRPEAAALKVEALAKLGRGAEARRLAERFTAEYGAGPLADRVSRFGASKP